jgi:molybdopterin-guanine dinucleotide biosynthesis protein MobB
MPADSTETLSYPLPVVGFAAWSGTGKTTLLRGLIPWLRARGLRIALIKHAHHDFDIDYPGKDSYELRKAGAGQVLVASDRRLAWIAENATPTEPRLPDLLTRLDASRADLVLIEGFRHLHFPKIELHRPALGKPLLCVRDDSIIAVAADAPPSSPISVPLLDLSDPGAIGGFVLDRFGIAAGTR